jgi:hypothetical protein
MNRGSNVATRRGISDRFRGLKPTAPFGISLREPTSTAGLNVARGDKEQNTHGTHTVKGCAKNGARVWMHSVA